MFELLPQLISGLFGLGGKLIRDKDKAAEFAFKIQEMAHELALKLLETKTYPWIDGLVKLAYASETLVKGLFRPIGGFVLFMYGLNHPDLIEKLMNMGIIGQSAAGGIFGSFPAWIVNRGMEKRRDQKIKAQKATQSAADPFDTGYDD